MIHLTGHNYNAREIIQNIFSPLVGVVSSSLADDICHKNNLTFVELLQPFTKLQNDAHFRDVSGTSVSIRGLRLNICDVDWRPPQTLLARKMLNEAVINAHNDKIKFITIGKEDLELPTTEPWFEQWRETFMTVQFPADHEFTRHFLSCLIILSSADPNIIETAHKLTQRVQQTTPQKLPKWFQPNEVLYSYVVLHEGSTGHITKAQQSFDLVKSTFGNSKSFLVQINSLDGIVANEIPDYWKTFIRRQPKTENNQMDQLSAPKTPQDAVSVISMPSMQMSLLADAATDNDLPILHPLSPVQEQASEAISSKFSISNESIASQNINPNVWAGDTDADAIHGSCLNAMDIENIRHFLQDYAVRALIPYVENLVANLNEAITNKKGVSKSLLSVTKRWFVSNKPGAGASNQNAVIYTNESSELQTRKMGDLYFMFCHYNLAFQAYHQAKRDFNADSAWQYYAGALEMAAISAFMLGTSNRKTYDYMEDAIVCYLNVCKLQQFATRATLLSMECLKQARLYSEAAKQLIRMTSEESDLRSALLLEQAAYCYLQCQPIMHRKYSFHIVLAGNRYSRSGQRKHAYRCYKQAYQVFQDRGWSLAEDHIQYTMAKQAYTLKKLEEASRSFAHLLRLGSLQSAQQQISFLKEYIQTQNELLKRNPELGILPHALPIIQQESIRVHISPNPPILSANQIPANDNYMQSPSPDENIWHKLEEMIVTTAAANKPFVFKPTRNLYTKENPAMDIPLAVQGEQIELVVTLQNTIRCNIALTNIDLIWKLKLDNDEEISNICIYENSNDNSLKAVVSAAVKTTAPASIEFDEQSKRTLHFKVTPKLTGRLNIIGMIAQVASATDPNTGLLGTFQFETLRIKTAAKQSNQTLFDNKLTIKIIPTVPALAVSFATVPTDLIAGEIIPVNVTLRNTGIEPIDDIFLGCENPRWITLFDNKDADDVPQLPPLSILSTMMDITNEKLVKDREIRRQHVFRLLKRTNTNEPVLKAQDTKNITMWIQAPYERCNFTLRLLFYYGMSGNASIHLKYRLVRHSWSFKVHDGLHTDISCVISNNITNDLGIDVKVFNANPLNHVLSTEIYLNSLTLCCPEYKLHKQKFYLMNEMELENNGKLGARCLYATKSASFQCRLELIKNNGINKTKQPATLTNYLKTRLSNIDLLPTHYNKKDTHVPSLNELHSFLIKHQTVFFNTNISTEEFNTIVGNFESNICVALDWSALIIQDGITINRIANGQNFIQLRYLYEIATCPPTISRYHLKKLDNNSNTFDKLQRINEFAKENQIKTIDNFSGIYNTTTKTTRTISTAASTLNQQSNINNDNNSDDIDFDDYWEQNENYVGRRCLLEDENFTLTVKS